ncbi:MAG: chloride channel protein [Planctomycetaceae bacterium]
MPLIRRISELLQGFEFRSTGKWFFLSSVVGIVAGLGAIFFQILGQVVMSFVLTGISGYAPGEARGEHQFFHYHSGAEFTPELIVLVMIAGGLVSGWLVYTFAPEAEGHGTDGAIEAFHNGRGMIRARIPFIKTIASAITLGTGGSGGREGPIAQIGAGFGSFLASRLKLSVRDRRIMLAAGMGAGVGAIFRAPLAGALFAGEILYRDADLESDVIVPTAISAIVGYSVYSLSLPASSRFLPLFGKPVEYSPISPLELLPFAALSLVLVVIGVLYIKTFYGTHALFKRVKIKPHFKPAIGAGLAGVVAFGLYRGLGDDLNALATLATGYGFLQKALTNPEQLGLTLLLIVGLVKIVTTSLTISSGGSGGVFGPSMVIGGSVGAAAGLLFHEWWPTLVPQPGVYALVGMAGFFAGCANAPFSTIIMVSEMTGNYNLLLPTMWVSTLCFLMSRRWTLYTKQVPTRLESAAHRGDFIVDILEGIKVDGVYRSDRKIELIPEGMTLDEIVHALTKSHQHYFPVVNKENKVVGIFSTDDVRSYLYDETIWHLAVARDIMVTEIVSVTPEDDLNVALQRFTALNLDELPVFDPNEEGKLLGMLRRKETIAAYNRQLVTMKKADED